MRWRDTGRYGIEIEHVYEHDVGLDTMTDRLGIELTAEESATVESRASGIAETVDQLDAFTPSDRPAKNIASGRDQYNAIRYRFDLDTSPTGRLEDVTVVLKDNLAVAGVPMHCGSAALEVVPPYHADVIRRLQESGAQIVGSTNMDEFAYHTTGETCAFGPTENPVVDDAVPGGSSSGSAAAVAAGLADAALGSDTGGSVRIPASYCGVVGLKPTYGRVSRFGFVFASPSLDHIGPIAQDVETMARVYDTIAGESVRDPTTRGHSNPTTAEAIGTSLDDLTIGVIEESRDGATDEVLDAIETALAGLRSQGVTCSSVSIPEYDAAALATLTISGREFAALASYEATPMGLGPVHGETIRNALAGAIRSSDLGGNVREQVLISAHLNDSRMDHYIDAKGVTMQLEESLSSVLERCDILVTPTTSTTAPNFGEIDSMPDFLDSVRHTSPFNLTGHPAMSIPVGNDAPVGLQLVGCRGDERTLIAVGAALES